MRMASMSVLVWSSFLVSSFRNVIPKQVRIASFILVIATFVTVVDYLIAAISLELAATGYRVIVNYRSDKAGALETLDQVRRLGADGGIAGLDVDVGPAPPGHELRQEGRGADDRAGGHQRSGFPLAPRRVRLLVPRAVSPCPRSLHAASDARRPTTSSSPPVSR